MVALEEAYPDAGRVELFTGSRSKSALALYDSLGYSAFAPKRSPQESIWSTWRSVVPEEHTYSQSRFLTKQVRIS